MQLESWQLESCIHNFENSGQFAYYNFMTNISEIDPVKVRRQHATYVEAKVKLEGQLLKLKEQREVLKDAGQKHEDQDMRENAKLQVNYL